MTISLGMRRLSRRSFVAALAVSAPALLRPRAAAAGTRALRFEHTHTGESLALEYAQGDHYLPDALAALNRFLRDHRTGDVHPIDQGLLDLLHGLGQLTGTSRPFQVISGYRSPRTNAQLRARSQGVAGGSLHMKGQAIDIRLSDVPLPKLHAAALAAARGGVGYYPTSNFVHVDTGRVRRW
jgi:uncharacterized protein YcbK (DUF882 family)